MELAEQEMVWMSHPGVDGGPWGPVSRTAFDTVYARKDPPWEEVVDPVFPDVVQVPQPLAEVDPAAMKRDELDALARSVGVDDPDKYPNKAEVAKAIKAADKPQGS